MQIMTLVLRRLLHFHLDAMGVGPRVLTDAGHLPGNFHSWLVGLDGEAAVVHFCRDHGLRKLADHRELIAEIHIESLEPGRHADDGGSAAIRGDVAVVDVQHVGRLDEGVVEVFVRRIQRMIDFEGAAGFTDTAINLDCAVKVAGSVEDPGAFGVYSNAPFFAADTPKLAHARSSVGHNAVTSRKAGSSSGYYARTTAVRSRA